MTCTAGNLFLFCVKIWACVCVCVYAQVYSTMHCNAAIALTEHRDSQDSKCLHAIFIVLLQ